MSFTYYIHPLVKQDYVEGYIWYEDKQNGLGKRFLQAIREKVEEIILHPEVFGSHGNKLCREAKVDHFPYLIVFKLNKRKREIYIVSVHHTSKNPRKKFRR